MEIVSTKNLYKGYFEVNRLYLKNKGNEYTRDWLQSKDAVAGVVYDRKKHLYVFVKQFRPGPQKDVIELVAGLIDSGFTPKETMIKEVEEEIGYKVDSIVEICNPFYTTPGKTNEKMHLFCVIVSEQISKGGGLEIENEDIEIIKVSKKQIKNLGIEDGKTLVGLLVTLPKINLLRTINMWEVIKRKIKKIIFEDKK